MSFPKALPPARTPDPMDAPPLRWGVLGTGWIAQRFCDAMVRHTRQRVFAVGSRTRHRADVFADAFLARNAGTGTGWPVERPATYGSYEALVADPDVDVVYVATPHHLHLPHGRLALEAGKATVVEKPMGTSPAEVAELQVLASARGLFLMEALWSAHLPKFDVVRQLLDDGALGTVHSVQADIGERFGPEHRIMRADLLGGPRHDLLTYPLWFARWVLGDFDEVDEVVTPAPTDLSADGVDGQIAVAARTAYAGAVSLFATILGDTPTTAAVSCGTTSRASATPRSTTRRPRQRGPSHPGASAPTTRPPGDPRRRSRNPRKREEAPWPSPRPATPTSATAS